VKEAALNHVSASASLGDGTTLGHFCVIGDEVRIGDGCVVGHHVVIHDGTQVADGVRIDDHAVIGKQPMRAALSAVTGDARQPPARLGEGCIVGTGAVIYAGATLGIRVLVADLATIREDVTIGDYTIVGRGVAVENRCTIGRYCKLETESYITAYSTLEDRVFIAPGVVTTNDNFVGRTKERFAHFKGIVVRRGGRVGAGATVLPGKVVGEDALVAAGAVVTRDAPPRSIVVGAPARSLRPVPPEQLLENQGWQD
jgi:UDP-2-acetamido-3-amino-2,3-dideoxy-glucuronate N-acetyltransferase